MTRVTAGDATPASHSGPTPEDAFNRQVRDALAHLHDLPYLQTHPLTRFIGTIPGPTAADPKDAVTRRSAPQTCRAGAALQQRLLAAIDTLRPRSGDRAGAKAARRHQVIALRYVEGLGAGDVQTKLAIGRSEYFREHRRGRGAVISLLHEQ